MSLKGWIYHDARENVTDLSRPFGPSHQEFSHRRDNRDILLVITSIEDYKRLYIY